MRGLHWHYEICHVLFSGSWDATIRMWDVRNCTCLHVSRDHYSDVYAIATHPSRPFFLASTSRSPDLADISRRADLMYSSSSRLIFLECRVFMQNVAECCVTAVDKCRVTPLNLREREGIRASASGRLTRSRCRRSCPAA